MLELTLVVPLMLSLAAGVFEFGNLIQKKILIEAGLRDGARYAARCNVALTGMSCISNAQNIAVTGSPNGSGSSRVSDWTTSHVSVEVRDDELAYDAATDTQNYRSNTQYVKVVRVSTSYPYTGVSLLSFLGIGPINISTSHEERVLGW